ncbi:signal peptidase II [Candidatus Woesearchaeota archaeon]|nr:signal peptidase II [Candidatus Woesearchaeota archaeon]
MVRAGEIKWKHKFLILLITVMIIAVDQMFKFLTSRLEQSIPIIKDVLHITFVQNLGAGFGTLQGKWWFLVVISLIAFAVTFYYFLKTRKFFLEIILAILLGGILGNLIDRIVFGFVRDFIDFRIWPVFNIADIVITISILLLIFYFWKEK